MTIPPWITKDKASDSDAPKRFRISKGELWKAIRAKCMDCSADSYKEIVLCSIPDCSLYPFRFGKPLTPDALAKKIKQAETESDNDAENAAQ